MQGAELVGYYPGVIGEVTRLHATYYARHWGLDLSFEAQVGRELAEFLERADPARDLFLAARGEDGLGGCVALDSTFEEGARLRWLIVEPAWHGQGLGRKLLSRCLDFARQAGHRRVFLWTFSGLDAARRLYEAAGFTLAQEHQVDQWGNQITEQKFELNL
ncbi:MAG: GNAT family N-acetyltransferase [Desulfarculaceae bacterium]|nr:GNAT family N-acetyltransferase [Desulfarculaceae bacterium]MCF8065700.1 GNAT family N-acetyltransferase [Desulfarculaceae bacterium]MCF8096910.1 GNAT family N-acetyltransferase [Desulfarculaceae bacterium]MCF8120889.1 GNAT family N-acetyltransferase [Desulfarculaceae bacterium]